MFFPAFFAHFNPHCDCSVRVLGPRDSHLPTLFLLYNSVAEILGFPTTKSSLYDNSPMHTAIFKLFPLAVNPVGVSKAQPFLRKSTLLTHWILIKFIPRSVPEFTLLFSLFN